MTALLSLILFSLAGLVLMVMLVQGLRRTRDLMCLRNIFLAGFVLFQLISGGLVLATEDFGGDVTVLDPARAGLEYLFLILLFLAAFGYSYRKGWLVRRAAWRRTFAFPAPRAGTLLMLGTLFLVLGFILRVVIGRNVPLLGVLTDILAIGILSGAAGLATWAWAPRLWNPAVGIPAALIILGSIGSTVFLTFGRRDVVSVLFTVLFAAYHAHWKHQNRLRLTYRFIAVVTGGIIFLAAFSTVRGLTAKEQSLGQLIQGLLDADVSGGLMALGTGQYAAANSMWLIENRPESGPYDPFHSVIYTVTNAVPRSIWPTKPEGLGLTMVRDARVYRASVNYTVGPGIIGHIVNDNPWLTLVPYAVFFGLFCRFFDEFITAHPLNPFMILPVVVGSGDMVGTPRGELGLFLFRCICAMAAAWVAMRVCAFLLRRSTSAAPSSPEEQNDYSWLESGDAEDSPYVPDLSPEEAYRPS